MWVWDKNRPTRIIPRTEVHTTQDVTIEELKTDGEIDTTLPIGLRADRRVAGLVLLAIDVGNTQTVVGLYDGERLADHWRTASVRSQTADELAVELSGLLAVRGRSFADVDCHGGVVRRPAACGRSCAGMARTHFGHEALIVAPGVETGLPLLVDNPHEVGPDRVANCVAALALRPGPLMVVDFGTAINFDAVSAAGEFVGGAIAPGVEVSMRRARRARRPAVRDRAGGAAGAAIGREHRREHAVRARSSAAPGWWTGWWAGSARAGWRRPRGRHGRPGRRDRAPLRDHRHGRAVAHARRATPDLGAKSGGVTLGVTAVR